MGINNSYNFLSNTDTFDDPLEQIKEKYKNYPNIIGIINLMVNSEHTFTFQLVTKNQTAKLI